MNEVYRAAEKVYCRDPFSHNTLAELIPIWASRGHYFVSSPSVFVMAKGMGYIDLSHPLVASPYHVATGDRVLFVALFAGDIRETLDFIPVEHFDFIAWYRKKADSTTVLTIDKFYHMFGKDWVDEGDPPCIYPAPEPATLTLY